MPIYFLKFLVSAPALACPLCHTTTADEVRAGLLATATDGSVLAAVVLPFLTVGVVVGLLNHRFFDEKERG